MCFDLLKFDFCFKHTRFFLIDDITDDITEFERMGGERKG